MTTQPTASVFIHTPAVGRLHRAVERPQLVPVLGASQAVVMTLDDVNAVLDLIAELCPEHQVCEACGGRRCEPCEIGDPDAAGCLHTSLWYCGDCALGMCQHCRAEAGQ